MLITTDLRESVKEALLMAVRKTSNKGGRVDIYMRKYPLEDRLPIEFHVVRLGNGETLAHSPGKLILSIPCWYIGDWEKCTQEDFAIWLKNNDEPGADAALFSDHHRFEEYLDFILEAYEDEVDEIAELYLQQIDERRNQNV